jgi:hypothetical protein
MERHIFAFYSVMLMVPCLILSLRMARLHGGMVLNGMLYARLMQGRPFGKAGDPERAARHNPFGASFLQFLLVNLIASSSAPILALALGAPTGLAGLAGVAVFVTWMVVYVRFHRRAAGFARRRIAAGPCAPFERNEWEAHVSGSLEDANHDLNAIVAFVGLMVFSVFETLSGIGQLRAGSGADLASEQILRHGPLIYLGLMTITCLMGLVTCLRMRVAIGRFSLMIDPTDRPFRPLQLTDSLLAYLLVAFLFVVSLHLLLGVLVPALERAPGRLLALDAAVLALTVVAEQVTLLLVRR